MFDTTPTDADRFEPRHDDHHRAIDDLDLDPGECRRVDDTPYGRSYHLRVGDLYLVIDSDGVRRTTPSGMHYAEAYGRTTTVDPGEAFAYLHGDFSPDVTNFCLGCGVVFDASEDRPCDCPVGSETESIDWHSSNWKAIPNLRSKCRCRAVESILISPQNFMNKSL